MTYTNRDKKLIKYLEGGIKRLILKMPEEVKMRYLNGEERISE